MFIISLNCSSHGHWTSQADGCSFHYVDESHIRTLLATKTTTTWVKWQPQINFRWKLSEWFTNWIWTRKVRQWFFSNLLNLCWSCRSNCLALTGMMRETALTLWTALGAHGPTCGQCEEAGQLKKPAPLPNSCRIAAESAPSEFYWHASVLNVGVTLPCTFGFENRHVITPVMPPFCFELHVSSPGNRTM